MTVLYLLGRIYGASKVSNILMVKHFQALMKESDAPITAVAVRVSCFTESQLFYCKSVALQRVSCFT